MRNILGMALLFCSSWWTADGLITLLQQPPPPPRSSSSGSSSSLPRPPPPPPHLLLADSSSSSIFTTITTKNVGTTASAEIPPLVSSLAATTTSSSRRHTMLMMGQQSVRGTRTRRSSLLDGCWQLLFTSMIISSPTAAYADFATAAGRRNCTTTSDPTKTVVTCTGGLLLDDDESSLSSSRPQGRLQSISASENGVSTSAIRNPTAYMAPWSYLTATSDAIQAWSSLQSAVAALPNCQIVTITDTYLHATVPTSSPSLGGGLDDLEFVLRPAERLVLFRSASQTTIYIYPLTQPVSDRGSNRRRLELLRDTLGWQEIQ
jgi:uncharacterized protein (DUF1499 family)